ncbi:MAG: hypothetical protein IJI83_05800 [Oscillospiraceae bacterium]|nr:hypothetical protein [Oscillospiraceae bacterium]MBQ6492319.1 hypothetical protein [Erysipelotrichaceae bacterium]
MYELMEKDHEEEVYGLMRDVIISLPEDFVIRQLLIVNMAEVMDMLLTQYNVERERKLELKEKEELKKELKELKEENRILKEKLKELNS